MYSAVVCVGGGLTPTGKLIMWKFQKTWSKPLLFCLNEWSLLNEMWNVFMKIQMPSFSTLIYHDLDSWQVVVWLTVEEFLQRQKFHGNPVDGWTDSIQSFCQIGIKQTIKPQNDTASNRLFPQTVDLFSLIYFVAALTETSYCFIWIHVFLIRILILG